ncbi:MAG: 2-oxoacid ferredoxin oxidoreductase, partial [Minisyncoccia bacterium]
KGYRSKSTPFGLIEIPINPLALAITQGATFVAQSFAGDLNHMVEMIKAGINHRGFSLINILQPCVTFNKINTYQYYLKRVYKLTDDYRKDNKKLAIEKALESEDEKFPLGIIYQKIKPTFTDQLSQIKKQTLINKERFTNYQEIIKEFV